MKPNGSGVQQLTFNDGPLEFDGEPSWSPDGRKIAFTSERDAVPETPFQVEIYTIRADGGDQTRLTFDHLSDFLPAWSPDGREIAFSSFRDVTPGTEGNAEVFTMGADGSDQVNRDQQPGLRRRPRLAAARRRLSLRRVCVRPVAVHRCLSKWTADGFAGRVCAEHTRRSHDGGVLKAPYLPISRGVVLCPGSGGQWTLEAGNRCALRAGRSSLGHDWDRRRRAQQIAEYVRVMSSVHLSRRR